MSSILIRRANIVSGAVPIDYSTRYLTLEALEAGTFSFSIPSGITTTVTSVSYSLDNGSTWVTTQNDSSDIVITTPTVQAGGKVLWKGMATRYATGTSVYSNFSSTGDFLVEGNIMSLLFGDSFADKVSLNSVIYALANLFYNCGKLTTAKNLILPAKTMTNSCYNSMFRNCTSLTVAPELPATTVAQSCYLRMFQDCTSLIMAPELLVATLKAYCYLSMFNGCSALNHIKCLATTLASGSCTDWVKGVAASGTFVKDPNMSGWGSGNAGIPSGWTVVDA